MSGSLGLGTVFGVGTLRFLGLLSFLPVAFVDKLLQHSLHGFLDLHTSE